MEVPGCELSLPNKMSMKLKTYHFFFSIIIFLNKVTLLRVHLKQTMEETIASLTTDLQEQYENMIMSASLDNDNDALECIPKVGRSGVSFAVHQEQITHTVQSLFKVVSELRALRAAS